MTAKDITESALRFLELLTAWSVIFLVIAIIFRRQIIEDVFKDALPTLVKRIKKASVAGAGTLEFGAEEAIAAFANAFDTSMAKHEDEPRVALDLAKEQVEKLSRTARPSTSARPLAGRSILWVDDEPSHNAFETKSLEHLGARVTPALSTDESLEQLKKHSFDLVISDISRTEDGETRRRAGYELLKKLSHPDTIGSRVPVILYTLNAAAKLREPDVVAYGARVADQPRDLIDFVLEALSR